MNKIGSIMKVVVSYGDNSLPMKNFKMYQVIKNAKTTYFIVYKAVFTLKCCIIIFQKVTFSKIAIFINIFYIEYNNPIKN